MDPLSCRCASCGAECSLAVRDLLDLSPSARTAMPPCATWECPCGLTIRRAIASSLPVIYAHQRRGHFRAMRSLAFSHPRNSRSQRHFAASKGTPMKSHSPSNAASLRLSPSGFRSPHGALRVIALACTGFLALGGCASINETGGKGRQALVCPQCKMVTVTVDRSYYGTGPFGYRGPARVYQDTCPSCQGLIETLFKEGRLKHKCSICKGSPFTCPIAHP